MLVNAFAKEANWPLLNMNASTIENKYIGESNKILKGYFHLADKIKPCVIFIDELDGIAKSRDVIESNHSGNLKTTLMMLMEKRDRSIFLISATNLLRNVDPAIRRRMRIHSEASLPSLKEKEEFLESKLGKATAEKVLEEPNEFSLSDLAELVRFIKMSDVETALTFFKNE
jgi:SpoVK/Ycf46/Vps4 family AAA+-type ATPase